MSATTTRQINLYAADGAVVERATVTVQTRKLATLPDHLRAKLAEMLGRHPTGVARATMNDPAKRLGAEVKIWSPPPPADAVEAP